ncbi:hypothetical protein SUDANB121_02467 [Nocardiopsis dassonvillei]|uniref:hypothetical protein n=1 Tax=Nocardiopsis dassonvillei TaxID=2014 RepID=UPI003F548909
MPPAPTLIGAALFLLGLGVAFAVEAQIILRDRAFSGEPVDRMGLLLLRSVLLPRSSVRFYLGAAAIGVVVWLMAPTSGYAPAGLLAAFVMWGSPSVDDRLRRLRTGRGPGGRREPRPLPPRVLADRGRRRLGAVLLAALAAGTVAVAATVGGWPAVAAVVVLAAAGSVVAQGFLVPRIVLDGAHLYLYGGRGTWVVPVEHVARVGPGERGVAVLLTDGTAVVSAAWARTPGRRRWTADRVRDFVTRTRPLVEGIGGRRTSWERTFPVDLFFAWICAGLVALALL